MIKIAYIIPNIEVGGTEKHLLSLVKNLDRGRFAPILITTAGGGALYDSFKPLLPVFVLGGDNGQARRSPPRNPLVHLRTIRDMVALLKEQAPHFVHAYLPAANALGPITARLARVPRVIVSKRSLANYKKGHPFVSRLESLGNLLADVILANSQAVRNEIKKTESFSADKIEVIYNGVELPARWDAALKSDFRKKEGLPEDAVLAVCVSNFFAYKGHEELIRAAAIMKKDRPDLVYLLIGRDAGNMPASKKLAAELGVEDKLRFLGVKDNPADFIRAADLFIHPSRQEGFSNSILEAMAAGLPVVACDVGGNAEAVTDRVTGRLAPKEDAPALADALAFVLKDPAGMKTMGEAGRAKAAELFCIKRMVSGVEGLYQRLSDNA
jgi:glycosyltransferase involved in cell wall biosynthesis